MGRTKIKDPRDVTIRVRLNKSEERKLNFVCDILQISKSDFLRFCVDERCRKYGYTDY